MLRSLTTLAAGLTLVISLSACKSTEEKPDEKMPAETQPAMGALNDKCPVMGQDIDSSSSAMYKGEKIGFCCAGCGPAWEKMTEDEKDAFVAKQK